MYSHIFFVLEETNGLLQFQPRKILEPSNRTATFHRLVSTSFLDVCKVPAFAKKVSDMAVACFACTRKEPLKFIRMIVPKVSWRCCCCYCSSVCVSSFSRGSRTFRDLCSLCVLLVVRMLHFCPECPRIALFPPALSSCSADREPRDRGHAQRGRFVVVAPTSTSDEIIGDSVPKLLSIYRLFYVRCIFDTSRNRRVAVVQSHLLFFAVLQLRGWDGVGMDCIGRQVMVCPVAIV